jgi:hypothetical protein
LIKRRLFFVNGFIIVSHKISISQIVAEYKYFTAL